MHRANLGQESVRSLDFQVMYGLLAVALLHGFQPDSSPLQAKEDRIARQQATGLHPLSAFQALCPQNNLGLYGLSNAS